MSATQTQTTRNKHFGSEHAINDSNNINSAGLNNSNNINNNNNNNNYGRNNTGRGNFNRPNSTPSIDITKDELSRISEALKKEEFRKLFLDYCEEIQDPENRKRYEDEIKQLEAERGVDVRFINPQPGFVIKTSADGQLKCFINVAQCEEVAKPTSEININQANGERGISWSLPMAQAPPRDDLDAHNKRCRVYDVVFHPDALHLAKRNNEFRKCVIDTALDAVEREFKVKLDRTNLKFPKLDYKGIARPTVIRKLAKNPPPETTEPHPLDNIYPARPTADAGQPKTLPLKTTIPPKPEFETPKYVIKHRRGIDLSEYTGELDAKLNVTLPRELVVEIELPLLSTAAECQLDVTERSIYLLSERAGAKYRIKIELPYAVDDKEGAARFDTDTRKLSITLPVIQPSNENQRNMHNTILHLNREDSGVDSDMRDESTTDGSSSPSESPIQELEQSFEQEEEEEEQLLEQEDKQVHNKAIEELVGDDDKALELKKSDSVLQFPDLTPENFDKASLPYKFPEKIDCNVLDEVMSFVLHVRNVQPESVITLQMACSLHLHFTSIGSGYYPNYYAFCLKLPDDCDLEIISIEAEATENNVVLNVQLSDCCENLETYLAGINTNNVTSYSIRNQCKLLPKQIKTILDGPISSDFEIVVNRPVDDATAAGGDAIEIEIKPRELKEKSASSSTLVGQIDEVTTTTTALIGENNESTMTITPTPAATKNTTDDDETLKAGGDAQATTQKKLSRKQKKRQKTKQRSLSESSFVDIKNALEEIEAEMKVSKEKANLTTAQNGQMSKPIPTTTLATQTPRKQRSYSECRDNSVAGSSENGSNSSLPFKGILKHHSRYAVTSLASKDGNNGHHQFHQQTRYFTSDSCSSSIEDCSSLSNSIDNNNASNVMFSSMQFSKSFSDIPEENASLSSALSESCKKTVRFNDIIQKQTFRLGSSILGQRKKNQKRRDCKLRALHRRHSEGDSADYDEDHKPMVLKSDTKFIKTETDTKGVENADSNDLKLNKSEMLKNQQQQKPNNHNTQTKPTKGKKKRHSKANSAHRQESESSDVDGSKSTMMFEIDLE